MSDPTRLRDDPSFRLQTGARLEDDQSLLMSHDYAALKQKMLASVAPGGAGGSSGGGEHTSGGESMNVSSATMAAPTLVPAAKLGVAAAVCVGAAVAALLVVSAQPDDPAPAAAPTHGVIPGSSSAQVPSELTPPAPPAPLGAVTGPTATSPALAQPGATANEEPPGGEGALAGAPIAAAAAHDPDDEAPPTGRVAAPPPADENETRSSEPGLRIAEATQARQARIAAGPCRFSLSIPPDYRWDLTVSEQRIEGGGVNLQRSASGVLYGFIWEQPTRLRVARDRIYGRIGHSHVDYDVTRGGGRVRVREHSGLSAAEQSEGALVVNGPAMALKVVRDRAGELKGAAKVLDNDYPAELSFERCDSGVLRDYPEMLMVLSFFFERQMSLDYQEVDAIPSKRQPSVERRRH